VTDVRNAQAVLMRPTGPLDADTCGEFRQQLASAFAAGVRAVAVDLAAVNGLSELLEIPASPPLRLLAGTGTGTSEDRPRVLSVVPGLKRPS
jgi:hypothetical protein